MKMSDPVHIDICTKLIVSLHLYNSRDFYKILLRV